MTTALALFAGVGFGVACDRLGVNEVGVEADDDVVATRDAAGMVTIGRDVWDWTHTEMRLHYELLTAGPPCQPFSTVGRGEGRPYLGAINQLLHSIGEQGFTPDQTRKQALVLGMDAKSVLVTLPLYVALRDKPDAIVLEQVPAVLPVWQTYAQQLERWGYFTWTGIVNAEQYGVPQTRKRAILLARRDRQVYPPLPTHSKYHTRHPDRLDPGVLPWVSMADAMGWPEGVVGFPRLADGRDEGLEIGDTMYRKRDFRITARPSWGVTSKTRSWRRWGFTARPATTVTGHGIATRNASGTQRAHLEAIEEGTFELREPYTMDTAKLPTFDNVSLSRSYHGDAVNISLEEGMVLQTFPDNFPFVGGRNRQWETIGNAVPPRLAEHLIQAVIS